MAIVTLLGKNLAKKGEEFTYIGPLSECSSCKVKNVCFNLKPGRSYTVKEVREKTHHCEIFEDDVVIVEVEELPIVANVSKHHLEGSTAHIPKAYCNHLSCPHYKQCNHSALQNGGTFTIAKIVTNKIDCEKGLNLHLVELTETKTK